MVFAKASVAGPDHVLDYLGRSLTAWPSAMGGCVASTRTYRWKDRSDGNQTKILTLPGVEFVRRYLRHVLPTGLRSVRYYGFCHPAAKKSSFALYASYHAQNTSAITDDTLIQE